MKKQFYLFVLFWILISTLSPAQQSRLSSLGGLSIGIEDKDNLLTPFDFGNNPAWLFMDEKETYLNISPAISNSWGSYHRKYDSEGDMYYGTSFKGIKPLGQLGTFLGYTSYDYEIRRNYNRTLKYDSYSGEAFFFVDTTAGNFHYNGPKVNLMYSWELLDNLYAGGSVTYQLLDGLKKVYTYAKTIYRNVGGNFGLAYELDKDIVIGAHYTFFDTQESIEAADVNLLEVETFNYRGETYFVPDRGSSVTQKIRKKSSTFSGQLFYQVMDELQAAIQTNYSLANSKVLIPEGSFKEVEEGYASFESFDVQFKSQYKIDENFTAGCYAAYASRDSWSRHSHKNLLLWDWNINNVSVGVGSSYKVTQELMVGIDYMLGWKKIDSTKYIDNRAAYLNSNDHTFRLGAEYKMLGNVFLRGGYSLNMDEYDIYYGGENVKNHSFTLGIGLPINESILLDSHINYSKISPGNNSAIARSFLGAFVTVRLNSF
ncbi:MAG: hypothetical protein HXY50_13840 [Ignavibacteriaceae bacterium]|nr:hypothetical protein [Ignavibacteriaceae bacterium]